MYLIFYLIGVGTLLPWNMFITAKDVSILCVFKALHQLVGFNVISIGLKFYIECELNN